MPIVAIGFQATCLNLRRFSSMVGWDSLGSPRAFVLQTADAQPDFIWRCHPSSSQVGRFDDGADIGLIYTLRLNGDNTTSPTNANIRHLAILAAMCWTQNRLSLGCFALGLGKGNTGFGAGYIRANVSFSMCWGIPGGQGNRADQSNHDVAHYDRGALAGALTDVLHSQFDANLV